MSIDLAGAVWRTATASNGNGACVEVGDLPGHRAVRDTKQKGHGPILVFTTDEWLAFLAGVKDSEFD
jgi:hypothetical protein